jgi:hypothetical protein
MDPASNPLEKLDALALLTIAQVLTYSHFVTGNKPDEYLLHPERTCPIPECGKRESFSVDDTGRYFSFSACKNKGDAVTLIQLLGGYGRDVAEAKAEYFKMAVMHDLQINQSKPHSQYKSGWYLRKLSRGGFSCFNLVGVTRVGKDNKLYLSCEGLLGKRLYQFAVPADEVNFDEWERLNFLS